jgi:hypothetical protein
MADRASAIAFATAGPEACQGHAGALAKLG